MALARRATYNQTLTRAFMVVALSVAAAGCRRAPTSSSGSPAGPVVRAQHTEAWQPFDDFVDPVSPALWLTPSNAPSVADGRLVMDSRPSLPVELVSRASFSERDLRIIGIRDLPLGGHCWAAGYATRDGRSTFMVRRDQGGTPNLFFLVHRDGHEIVRRDLGPPVADETVDFAARRLANEIEVDITRNGALALHERFPASALAPASHITVTSYCGAAITLDRIDTGPGRWDQYDDFAATSIATSRWRLNGLATIAAGRVSVGGSSPGALNSREKLERRGFLMQGLAPHAPAQPACWSAGLFDEAAGTGIVVRAENGSQSLFLDHLRRGERRARIELGAGGTSGPVEVEGRWYGDVLVVSVTRNGARLGRGIYPASDLPSELPLRIESACTAGVGVDEVALESSWEPYDAFDGAQGPASAGLWKSVEGAPVALTNGRLSMDATGHVSSVLDSVEVFDQRAVKISGIRQEPGSGRCWLTGLTDPAGANNVLLRRDQPASDHVFLSVQRHGAGATVQDLGAYQPGTELSLSAEPVGDDLWVTVQGLGLAAPVKHVVSGWSSVRGTRVRFHGYCSTKLTADAVETAPRPWTSYGVSPSGTTSSDAWSFIHGQLSTEGDHVLVAPAPGMGVTARSLVSFHRRSVRFRGIRETPGHGRCWSLGYHDLETGSMLLVRHDLSSDHLFLDVRDHGTTALTDLGELASGAELDFVSRWTGPDLQLEVTIDGTVVHRRTISAEFLGRDPRLFINGYCSTRTTIRSIETEPAVGLVAYWNADGHADDVVGGHHVAVPPGYGPGRQGQAFRVTRETGLPTRIAPLQQFTVSFWFALDAPHDASVPYSTSFVKVNTSSTFRFFGFANSDGRIELGGAHDLLPRVYSTTAEWQANRWYHAALSYDGTTYRLYVDGQRQAEKASTPSLFADALTATLGSFDGRLDDVALFGRALTDAEVATLRATPEQLLPAFGVDPQLCAQSTANLLANGTLDCGVGGWSPFTWEHPSGAAADHRVTLSSVSRGERKRALRVEVPTLPDLPARLHGGVAANLRTGLAAGSHVKVAFDARRIGASGPSHLFVTRAGSESYANSTVALTEAWTHHEVEVVMFPVGATQLLFVPQNAGAPWSSPTAAGTFELDDVVVTATKTADPACGDQSIAQGLAQNARFDCDTRAWTGIVWDTNDTWASTKVTLAIERADVPADGGAGALRVAIPAEAATPTMTSAFAGVQASLQAPHGPGRLRVTFDAKPLSGARNLRITRLWGGSAGDTTVTLRDGWSHYEVDVELVQPAHALGFALRADPAQTEGPVAAGVFLLDNVDVRPAAPACTPTSCDDGNPCTIDACSGTACTHRARSDAPGCVSPGPVCSTGDAAAGGCCPFDSLAAVGGVPSAGALVSISQSFETCSNAWTLPDDREAELVQDGTLASCRNDAGRVVKLPSSGTVRSSWFDLIAVAPGQPHCFAAVIRWTGGPAPTVALAPYDAGKVPLGQRLELVGFGAESLAPASSDAWLRYGRTFVPTSDTHFVQIELGRTASVTKPGADGAFFDELRIARGACVAPGT